MKVTKAKGLNTTPLTFTVAIGTSARRAVGESQTNPARLRL
jgi:hypothetical protein